MSRLKTMREMSGLTQKELAEKSGVKLRQIQHYEQGTHSINGASVITVIKLSMALDCDIYDIIEPWNMPESLLESLPETPDDGDEVIIDLS